MYLKIKENHFLGQCTTITIILQPRKMKTSKKIKAKVLKLGLGNC